MFESFLKLVDWLKGQSPILRVLVLLIVAALAIVLSFTSCARSSMRFKGTGEVEYLYKGSLGPSFSSSNSE